MTQYTMVQDEVTGLWYAAEVSAPLPLYYVCGNSVYRGEQDVDGKPGWYHPAYKVCLVSSGIDAQEIADQLSRGVLE